MRLFKTSPYGDEVDLDDPKTYQYLPKTLKKLRDLMLSEIGYAYCYMNYWHSDIFDGKKDGGQKTRANSLIKEFTDNEGLNENYLNLMWYKERIFLFQNEIENMC